MIIPIFVLVIIFIIAFIFFGMKMSESIKNKDIRIFFFILFFCTILTITSCITSGYFIHILKNKKGERGSKGKAGPLGDTGEAGYCKSTCKKDSLKFKIIKEINESDEEDKDSMKQTICNNFRTATNYVPNTNEPAISFEELTMNDIKNFNLDNDYIGQINSEPETISFLT